MARAKEGVKPGEFAAIIGKSVRQVTNYRAEGMPFRNGPDGVRYVPSECINWLLARERELAKAAAVPGVASQQLRKLRADADLRELELLERRHLLVPTTDSQEAFEALVGGFVSVATGQLQRFERPIVQAVTLVQARQLTDQIQDALIRGARAYADQLELEATAPPAA